MLPAADPAATEVASFDGYYTWSRVAGAAIPALASWTPWSATVSVDPGDVYVQKIMSVGLITPPAWAVESTIFLLYVRRFGTDASDTYDTNKDHGTVAANLGILSADLHYQIERAASEIEFPT